MRFLPKDDPRHRVWAACESPIEQILCCALFAQFGCKATFGAFSYSRCARQARDEPTAFLFSQHHIGRYRADLLLALYGHEHRRIVLECDGADYHSSPEQCAYDMGRDAQIVRQGYSILRFNGSEIVGSIDEVMTRIERLFDAVGVPREPAEDCNAYNALFGFTRRLSWKYAKEERDRRAELARQEDEEERLAEIRRKDAAWL